MALNPVKSVKFDDLAHNYGAIGFQDALGDFLAHLNHPSASTSALRQRAADTLSLFAGVPVFHNIKFTNVGTREIRRYRILRHARPEVVDTYGRVIPARFDTVIVHHDSMHGQQNKGMSPFISKLVT